MTRLLQQTMFFKTDGRYFHYFGFGNPVAEDGCPDWDKPLKRPENGLRLQIEHLTFDNIFPPPTVAISFYFGISSLLFKHLKNELH